MTTPVSRPESAALSGNLRGLLVMTAGFAAFSTGDMLAKLLTADFHPVQIVWTRQLGLLAIALALFARQGTGLFRSRAAGLQIGRGVAAVVSAVAFTTALAFVPLADAVAVSFVAPFMVTIMGALFLKEAVGRRRWGAVIVGFLGALVVIRPGAGVLHPAIGLVVLAALAFAARQVLSRRVGGSDPTRTTIAFTALTSASLLTLALPFFWTTPSTMSQIALMLGLAAFAGLGEVLIIRALELADAVVVAPMQYSLILFSTFWGVAVFGHLPDGWTWAGAAIIIVSGLYTLHRETRRRA